MGNPAIYGVLAKAEMNTPEPRACILVSTVGTDEKDETVPRGPPTSPATTAQVSCPRLRDENGLTSKMILMVAWIDKCVKGWAIWLDLTVSRT